MTDSEQDPTLGTCEKLAAKIAKVMAAIGEVPKNGHNDRFNYSYPLDEDVMKALREAMTEHGLVAIPSVVGRSMTKETTSGGTVVSRQKTSGLFSAHSLGKRCSPTGRAMFQLTQSP